MSRKLIALILISTITCSLLSGCGSMINVGAKEAPDESSVSVDEPEVPKDSGISEDASEASSENTESEIAESETTEDPLKGLVEDDILDVFRASNPVESSVVYDEGVNFGSWVQDRLGDDIDEDIQVEGEEIGRAHEFWFGTDVGNNFESNFPIIYGTYYALKDYYESGRYRSEDFYNKVLEEVEYFCGGDDNNIKDMCYDLREFVTDCNNAIRVLEGIEVLDADVDPYYGVLLRYKEAQDKGLSQDELDAIGFKTALIDHGWPNGTNNDEVRYHYYDIGDDNWIDLIITYYGAIVDIYSHDGDAVYSYGAPYRGIAELYPDGTIRETISMGVSGSATNWLRYDVSSGKFILVDGQLTPTDDPVVLPEGKKISDVGKNTASYENAEIAAYAYFLSDYMEHPAMSEELSEDFGEEDKPESEEDVIFSLIYIDDDDIPELTVANGTAPWNAVHVFTYKDGEVVEAGEYSMYGRAYYTPKKGQILPMYYIPVADAEIMVYGSDETIPFDLDRDEKNFISTDEYNGMSLADVKDMEDELIRMKKTAPLGITPLGALIIDDSYLKESELLIEGKQADKIPGIWYLVTEDVDAPTWIEFDTNGTFTTHYNEAGGEISGYIEYEQESSLLEDGGIYYLYKFDGTRYDSFEIGPDDDNVCMMNFFGRVYYKFQED